MKPSDLGGCDVSLESVYILLFRRISIVGVMYKYIVDKYIDK